MPLVSLEDQFPLYDALWVIKTRLQRNIASKYTFFFIFPFEFRFDEETFTINGETRLATFISVSGSIDLSITLHESLNSHFLILKI